MPIVGASELERFRAEAGERTLYALDVRDPPEYALGHPAGFASAPGGQLVQASDEWLGVRGARIVLFDDDGVRARMAASWLIQMGWDVHVLDETAELAWETQAESVERPATPGPSVTPSQLDALADATVVDLARSPDYRKGHVPGAWLVSGPDLARDIAALPGEGPIVLASRDGTRAAANLPDAASATARRVLVLAGGTAAFAAEGRVLETEGRWLGEPVDVYKRPYEGTDNARANMQAYIDWELQLVAQLANDGVSGFHVVREA